MEFVEQQQRRQEEPSPIGYDAFINSALQAGSNNRDKVIAEEVNKRLDSFFKSHKQRREQRQKVASQYNSSSGLMQERAEKQAEEILINEIVEYEWNKLGMPPAPAPKVGGRGGGIGIGAVQQRRQKNAAVNNNDNKKPVGASEKPTFMEMREMLFGR